MQAVNRRSTIAFPALLGSPRVFAREAKRIREAARSDGLFCLPLERDGPDGLTQPEREAVRCFDMIAEAFGLTTEAVTQLHWMLALGHGPRFAGPLFSSNPPDLLHDLWLRAHTFAVHEHAQGRGDTCIRIWRRARPLRSWLDSVESARAAYAQQGACVTPEMIGWVAESRRLYDEIARKAPHLVRLMPTVHRHLSRDAEAPDSFHGLRELRNWLMQHGLTAAGWRWLARNPFTARNWQNCRYLTIPVHTANGFAAAGEDFLRARVETDWASFVAVEAGIGGWNTQDTGWLLRALERHASELAVAGAATFLDADEEAVLEWLTAGEWRPDSNQRRVGWPAVMAAWRRRHRDPSALWDVPFPEAKFGRFTAFAIGNGWQLWEEGEAMGHCIADYLSAALKGCFLAFSLRDENGERVATFSVKRARAHLPWEFDQCLGPRNSAVEDTEALEAVEAMIDTLCLPAE
jgi:hypothetical protein